MPKLDLTRAIQIKGASGNIAKLKGSGFLWEAPYLAGGEHPDLIADFEQERYLHSGEVQDTLPDLATFARASNATYTDSNGIIQTATTNTPRVGHHTWDGSQWVNQGLLLESVAATNLLTESNDFEDASWTIVGSDLGFITSSVSNQAISPDGNTTAGALIEANGGTAAKQLNSAFTFSNQAYTFSLFVKPVSRTWCRLMIFDGATFFSVYFDLDNGSIGTEAANTKGNIEAFGDGWFRLSVSATTAAGTGVVYFNGALADGGVDTYTGETGKGYYIYQADLVAASIPSSPIPTSGSTATRAAETLTIPNPPWPATVEATGTELVTNGTFDTDTDWTKGAGWTIGSGVASCDGSQSSASNLFQSSTGIEVNKVYQVSYSITRSSGGWRLFFGGNNSTPLSTASATDTVLLARLTGSANEDITIQADASFVGTVDNISVKEITPRGLAIAMDGLVAGSNSAFANWALDANNGIQITSGASDFTFTQEAAGVVDSVTGGSYTSGINVPFSIASRHGDNFINGAVDGTALTANLTPTILPDLSSTSIQIGNTFNGYIKSLRIWDVDIGDAGIEDASS